MYSNMISNRILKIAIILILTLSTSSCLIFWTKTGDAEDYTNNKSILVYGFLDDSEAPFSFRWGQLRQMLPKTDEPFLDVKLNKKGLFYLENLPVGSYTIHNLGGPEGFFSNNSWRWTFPSPSDKPEFKLTELRATAPGIYFMGAYKIYESRKGGFFRNAEYSSLPVDKPSEVEILKQLLVKTHGTKWEALVLSRINKLTKG